MGRHALSTPIPGTRIAPHLRQALPLQAQDKRNNRLGAPWGSGTDSVVIQAKRKRHRRSRFLHFSRSQPRDTIADVAFGNGLEIVEVRSAGVRQAIVFSQHDFCGDAAAPRPCSLTQMSNSPGATGFRA